MYVKKADSFFFHESYKFYRLKNESSQEKIVNLLKIINYYV